MVLRYSKGGTPYEEPPYTKARARELELIDRTPRTIVRQLPPGPQLRPGPQEPAPAQPPRSPEPPEDA